MGDDVSPQADAPADELAPIESAIPPRVVPQQPPPPAAAQIPFAIQQVSVSIGPLPPPEVIAAYENAIPGTGKRFFNVWQEEAEHRRSLELAKVTAEVKDVANSRVEARRGQLAALTLGLVAVVAGVIVAGVAAPTAGGFIAVSGVTAILTAFLNQKPNKPSPDPTAPTGS